MPVFECNQQKMVFTQFGDGETIFVWAHGWGQNKHAMENMVPSLAHLGRHILIDFPGFGESPIPRTDWTVNDYANFCNAFLKSLSAKKIIWIGHSFGCRVGIKLASLFPDALSYLILLSAPGLPRQRPWYQAAYFAARIRVFKILKHVLWKDTWKDKLRTRFSSPDFNNAGPLKQIFLNTIRDNLANDAKNVLCPVLLLCGTDDTETPPDISRRYAQIMPHARFLPIHGCNHYTILTHPQIPYHITQFIHAS